VKVVAFGTECEPEAAAVVEVERIFSEEAPPFSMRPRNGGIWDPPSTRVPADFSPGLA